MCEELYTIVIVNMHDTIESSKVISASNYCRCMIKVVDPSSLVIKSQIVYYLTALPSSEHTKLAESLTRIVWPDLLLVIINRLMIRAIFFLQLLHG